MILSSGTRLSRRRWQRTSGRSSGGCGGPGSLTAPCPTTAAKTNQRTIMIENSGNHLMDVVNLVEREWNFGRTVEVPVTLLVGGFLIHGAILPRQLWYQRQRGWVEELGARRARRWWLKILRGLGLGPRWIHFAADRVFSVTGGKMFPQEGLLWRIRLAAVAGVMYGSMREAEGGRRQSI